jgi:hypothetical protein
MLSECQLHVELRAARNSNRREYKYPGILGDSDSCSQVHVYSGGQDHVMPANKRLLAQAMAPPTST